MKRILSQAVAAALLDGRVAFDASRTAVGRERRAQVIRLTVFDYGYEWFPMAAIAWLAQHGRP